MIAIKLANPIQSSSILITPKAQQKKQRLSDVFRGRRSEKFPNDLVTFTEEIFSRKLYFLRSECYKLISGETWQIECFGFRLCF